MKSSSNCICIKSLAIPDNIKKMIDFIASEPLHTFIQPSYYKQCQSARDALSCQSKYITESLFMSEKNYPHLLLEILKRDATPANRVIISYVSQIISAHLGNPLMLKHFNKGQIYSMLTSVYYDSNSYILVRIVALNCTESDQVRADILLSAKEYIDKSDGDPIIIETISKLIANSFKMRMEHNYTNKCFAVLLTPTVFEIVNKRKEQNQKWVEWLEYLNLLISLIVFRDCGNLLEAMDPLYVGKIMKVGKATSEKDLMDKCKQNKIVIEYEQIIDKDSTSVLQEYASALLKSLILSMKEATLKGRIQIWKYIYSISQVGNKDILIYLYSKDFALFTIVMMSFRIQLLPKSLQFS